MDGNGGGLIASLGNLTNGAEWGCYGLDTIGANGSAIGSGAQNTIAIEAGCTTPGIAADICANYTDGTYSDWFLPSKDELNQMYKNRNYLDGIGSWYWSSTEQNVSMSNLSPRYSAAWCHDFGGGSQRFFSKTSTLNVRAVRAF